MELFLGVAQGLRAMHQYRVGGGGGSGVAEEARSARQVRDEAEEADEDAARRAGATTESGEPDIEQTPLMDGEIVRSQEGVEAGELRAYAHRDVKPGMRCSIISRAAGLALFNSTPLQDQLLT